MTGSETSNEITFVVKCTKLCNLRCRYCYEFNDLSDPRFISIDQLHSVASFVAQFASLQGSRPKIVWHGGEPTLRGPEYFRSAREIFNQYGIGEATNIIQTNLLKCTKKEIELFGYMDFVSVSFDAFGSDRVKQNGVDVHDIVLKNIDHLKNCDINFGAINVLTSKNVRYIDKIVEFYTRTEIPVRFLPFYRRADEDQEDMYSLTNQQIADAFMYVMDWSMSNELSTRISPIRDFLRIAIDFRNSAKLKFRYNKSISEGVLIIDRNGDVYSDGTAYNSDFCYGNIFRDSAQAMWESPGRKRNIRRSNALQAKTCRSCKFWGYCSGIEMAEATDIEIRNGTDAGDCSIWKPCIERMQDWIAAVDNSDLQDSRT